jgi:hypothetical protein
VVLNAKQRRALLIGVVGFIAIGGFPPWKDTSPPPAGSPLPFAPISMPPSVPGHSIEIDVVRLGIMWVLMVVVTGASIWMGKDLGKEERDPEKDLASGKFKNNIEPLPSLPLAGKSSGAKILDSITSEARTSKESADALKLKFPERKVGEILSESEDDPEYWTLVSDARGRVLLPAGKRLQLEIAKEGEATLDFLSSMGNKEARSAIVSLDLSQTDLNVESLSYLRFLPALEELDLSGTEIGDDDLDEIIKLTQLKKLWLDDTKTSKVAADKLSLLTNLKKLSLSHLDADESEINSLKLRIPSCEVVVREGKS